MSWRANPWTVVTAFALLVPRVAFADGPAPSDPAQPSAPAPGVPEPAQPTPPTPEPVAEPVPAPAPVRDDKDKQVSKPRQVRDGLVLGFDLGFGIAKAGGFPNDPKSIGVESTRSRSNVMMGAPYTILLQGSIHDQVNFGFMVHMASYTSERWRSSGGGVGFRVDGFPLMQLVPALRDLGLFGQAGVGFSKLSNKANLGPDADTVQSYLGVGAFYEFTLAKFSGSHVAVGPQFGFDTVFSRDYSSSGAAASMRLVFYTGK